MKLKVLVLGASGLVGQSLIRHLNLYDIFDITFTYNKNFPKEFAHIENLNFDCLNIDKKVIKNIFSKYDYIVNCIIDNNNFEKLTDNLSRSIFFKINSFFPKLLADYSINSKSKIIQLSSDAVFSGKKGTMYNESDDVDPVCPYGISKLLGEQCSDNVINIRSSFIGNSPYKKKGLIEWINSLKNDEDIYGFHNYIWSGVTTLQLSYFLYKIIVEDLFYDLRKFGSTLHLSCNAPLSKYELLIMISKAFNKKLNITKKNDDNNINRSLISENPIVNKLNEGQISLEASLEQLYKERLIL